MYHVSGGSNFKLANLKKCKKNKNKNKYLHYNTNHDNHSFKDKSI